MINLKKYCLINLILFSALFSRGLTLDEIINVSNNFIIERSDYEFTIDSINLESLNDYSLFYVVDLIPQGFLLISANNETIPVLGYSFEHDFNPNSLPAQLSKILDSYKENIVYVLSNQLSPNNNIESLWDRYLSDNIDRRNLREVSPLITANWNQGGQWNNMCPGQALVGCVAVAMGQVMYYWANPSEGNGYTAYYHQEYGPISINFEDYSYDFNGMMDNEATEASQLLLYHAGVAVHMDYSHWGSGASVCWEGPSAQHALVNHYLRGKTTDVKKQPLLHRFIKSQLMTGSLANIKIIGKDRSLLTEKWRDGPQTYLGLASNGFPNMFMITGPGSPSVLTNMLPSIEQHVNFIAGCISHVIDNGLSAVEPDRKAEEDWGLHVNEVADLSLRSTCASWYVGANVPGKPRVFSPYIGGFPKYVERCEQVAGNNYEGFTLV